ncbi:MAG: 2-hydroxyacid dehydrogenase, partial [Burkholderiales bacterium]
EGSAAHERARALGEVRVHAERGAENEAELARRIGNADVAINIRSYARFTEAVFRACPRMKLISIWGTGTDNIDLAAAALHGVTVCNTPGVNAYAVAEHTIALMLAVARRIPQIDRGLRTGAWPRDMLEQLCGKTLVVFGAGAIGARVAQLARGFGMEVLTWSVRGDTAATKDDFLRRADFVTLHLRLVPETRGFIGRREFALMRPGAFLINTARGPLVDREALLEALASRSVAGAGLDVFHDEPVKPDDALLLTGNTVLSPHNAGQTPEVRRDGLLRAIENVEGFLSGKPINVVRS